MKINGIDIVNVANAMKKYGGGFAASIGEAALNADSGNLARVVAAFPELFDKYSKAFWQSNNEGVSE